jgi:hypothetical protein
LKDLLKVEVCKVKKVKLTEVEIDGLVSVKRVVVKPTVYGVGFNDVGFQPSIDGKHIWQYILWKNMLNRCFSEKEKQRHPTYKNVACCDEWLSFANFFEWVNKEVGYKGKPVGFELDKDIIVKGNKVYSPEFCSFVPTAVNLLLTDRSNDRGEFPVGVYFDRGVGKFKVQFNCFGKSKYLGLYTTAEDASFAYKTAKEAHIKIVATQYKDVLSPAVYESLMGWEIDIGD